MMHLSTCPKQPPAKPRPNWEVADILRLYGDEYRRDYNPPGDHRQIMHLLEICRTISLGGHIEKCDSCSHLYNAYNSCRNRHCPKCQTLTKEKWLQDRKRELLPAKYFHAVFTIDHKLNPLILINKKVCFDILFRSVNETLQEFAKDPRWKLEGQLGFIAILHTWSQVLLEHFHLHCVIPAGALSFDRTRWISPPSDTFLFHVGCLSQVFRHKFLDHLKKAYRNNKLIFPGRIAPLKNRREFYNFINTLYDKEKKWVVYLKHPFAGPEKVLEYLARYTHRVAISNNRIRSVDNGKVTFSYKKRSEDYRSRSMTVDATEFIRRFLLHTLPSGFMRIRYFGFLANTSKKHAIPLIRQSLGQSPDLPEKVELSVKEMMLNLTGIDISRCPRCKTGTMVNIGEFTTRNPRCHGPPHQ
ncbi:MAG: IS91 family transposase [Candidatus Auribacterota bacterium]|nr:IS91 family transposase [Candidatus Auribacterota bacterium]